MRRAYVAAAFFTLVLIGAVWTYSHAGRISERSEPIAPPPSELASQRAATEAGPEPSTPVIPTARPNPVQRSELVTIVSGRFDTAAVPEVRKPVHIELVDLGVSAPIVPVGYDPARDEMQIPESANQVGWYEFSASPGESGSSVLAAHVDWNGRRGAFFDLYRSEPGSLIVIEFEDGAREAFEVVAAEQFAKKALPTDDLFARQGDPILTLITCGGVFNEAVRSYEDNVVVYARPLG